MPNDQPGSITLAIADCPSALQVVGFTGREALNETWRFDIDLISRDPHLDVGALLQRRACLKPCPGHPGVQGEIGSASQVYAGTCLSHYRLSLWPRLQRLAQPRRQHAFRNLSVPQLIEHLLRERGLGDADYRFEPLYGVYPPRPLCMQHQESDLHLLQRLCEEEGIHFRFDGQQLVFADDCASFPERSGALYFMDSGQDLKVEQISHLAESLRLQPAQPYLPAPPSSTWLPVSTDAEAPSARQADNQPYPKTSGLPAQDPLSAWQRQRSARQLQCLRTERRQISGCSQLPTLVCGQVIQVLGHPELRLNDHWLLTWIRHAGKQPEVFEGHDPHDVAAISRLLSSAPLPDAPVHDRFDSGYRNRFGVTLWTEPFRPALRHPKPTVHGLQAATLLGSEVDPQGCLPIRMDWQAEPVEPGHAIRALLVNPDLPAYALRSGCRVQIGYLDNDPDRPLICAVLPPAPEEPATRWWVDDQVLEPLPQALTLQDGQTVRVQSNDPVTLQGLGTVQVGQQDIAVTSRNGLQLGHPAAPAVDAVPGPLPDLHLPPEGKPPAHCLWYIVRMARPGLEHLSRLDPEHFLFEGRTDEKGYLGLTPEQRHQLAIEYARTPDHLCLIHPGRCITLNDFFRQHSNEQQHRAWLATGEAFSDVP
ncbi:type VI secretion system Vgr family protein [Pseudomonas ovata]|uniref:type VI secretion system Vgr family protein n=1 Tax=Pseudomonas ovata TaxID=1839709 RepID=UPI000D68F24F|nr:contractile injection system protein, VgrG/Pvc8 family [Pseudomonas ovata]